MSMTRTNAEGGKTKIHRLARRTLAIDASFTRTGWAFGHSGGIEFGSLAFKAPAQWQALRFRYFREWIEDIMVMESPDIIVFEEPTTLSRGKGQQTLYGIKTNILEVAAAYRVPTHSLTATALKKFATDSGKAEKQAMMETAESLFEMYDPELDSGGDIADALLLLYWSHCGCPKNPKVKKKVKA